VSVTCNAALNSVGHKLEFSENKNSAGVGMLINVHMEKASHLRNYLGVNYQDDRIGCRSRRRKTMKVGFCL
jgi:hypothetical protein